MCQPGPGHLLPSVHGPCPPALWSLPYHTSEATVVVYLKWKKKSSLTLVQTMPGKMKFPIYAPWRRLVVPSLGEAAGKLRQEGHNFEPTWLPMQFSKSLSPNTS